MRHGRPALLALIALLAGAPAASAADSSTRYAMANGCFSLTSSGQTVGGPFFMKPTALGSYMLFTKDKTYFAKTGDTTVGTIAAPSADSEWTVEGSGGKYSLTVGGRKLVANGTNLSLGVT